MNKIEFLKLLKAELNENRVANIQDILSDYEEHFTHGLSKGKSEEEICRNLGSPITIAKAYETESMIQEIKNPDQKFQWRLALNVVMRLMVLAPFNFFVLFIPGVIVFSLLVSGWAVAISLGAAGLAIMGYLPALGSLALTAWAWIAGISTSLGLLGMGVLIGMVMFLITKYILIALIGYLQWNLKFVLEK